MFNNKMVVILLITLIGTICNLQLIETTEIPECISQSHELWPHENPNFFWYCHTAGSVPIKMPCPEGRGFIRTDKASGCVPYINWECTTKIETPPACQTTADYNKPHRHPNPNYFWGCPEPQGTPGTLLKCKENYGYVENDHNLGCMPFEKIGNDPDQWVCAEYGNPKRE